MIDPARLKQLEDDYAFTSQEIERLAQQRLRLEGALLLARELMPDPVDTEIKAPCVDVPPIDRNVAKAKAE